MPSTATKHASITPDILARINPAPKGGDGFNNWLLHAANHLCNAGVPEGDARDYLFEQQWHARGRREDREIKRVLDRAYRPNAMDSGSAVGLSEKVRPGQEDPPEQNERGDLARPNEEPDTALQAAAIADNPITAGDLLSLSPLEFAVITAADALRALMGGNPETLVCTGKTTTSAKTMPLEKAAAGAAKRALVVPSPMTTVKGTNKEGNPSNRCLDNTGPRRFLVIEFDNIESKDDQASLLLFLGKFAPLCAVVDSGGKSLHGWFYCEEQPETDLWRFMRVAVLLGADPMLWTRCQLARMPEGRRETGESQTLFYFDHDKIGSNGWDLGPLLEWEAENRSEPAAVLPGEIEAYYNGKEYVSNIAEQGDLGSQQPSSGLPLKRHDELGGVAEAMDFIEGVLTEGGASVLYGASNTGKTFYALELEVCTATGRPFRGLEVDKGAVIHLALEGETGIKNRLHALKRDGRLSDDAELYVSFHPISLLNPADRERLIATVKDAAARASLPVQLVVIDTLSRAMAGGDENASTDMSEAVAAIDAVREATGAHVMLIHHCGKDAARGARGHSSLRGAVDTEIEVSHDETSRISTVVIEKQRDLPKLEPMPFRLQVVHLGINRRGKPITSCVVQHEDASLAVVPRKKGRKKDYTPEQLLAALPANTVTEWFEKVQEETGMARSTFNRIKTELEGQKAFHKEGGELREVSVS